MGHHHYARGEFSKAAQLYARCAGALQTLGDTRGESAAVRGIGNVCKYLGLYSQAAENYERAMELSRKCADTVGLASAEHNQGNVFLALDDIDAAEAAYRRALDSFRQADREDLVRHTLMSLATTAHRRRNFIEALALLRRAAPPSPTSHVHAGDEAERLIAVAEAEAGRGRKRAALASIDSAILLARAARESHTEALAHRTRATLTLALRRPAGEASADARRGLKCSRAARTPTEITGELHELAARAAGRDARWRTSSRHYQLALAEQKRLASHRNRERANILELHRELSRARHHAELARLENARLSEALAEIAARLESPRSDPSNQPAEALSPESFRGLGLRPRECEVLLWVARGKSNEEIGMILGCSHETVKSHLKRIYLQLDVTNRTAAAARALSVGSP